MISIALSANYSIGTMHLKPSICPENLPKGGGLAAQEIWSQKNLLKFGVKYPESEILGHKFTNVPDIFFVKKRKKKQTL